VTGHRLARSVGGTRRCAAALDRRVIASYGVERSAEHPIDAYGPAPAAAWRPFMFDRRDS
jgi:hypothetical protein